MKKVIIFILLIFYLGVCFSQTVTISGSIISSNDRMPINNVNISVINSKQWTSSNNKGEFVLKDVKLPVVLKVSHLAYLNQEISLSKNDIKKKNKINLDIMLVDKVSPLSEIVIREKPKNMLERLVYDFEVDSSSVYVINNSKDKKQLQTYSFDDYLKNKIFIPDECNAMKYDYSNTLSVKNRERNEYYKVIFNKKREIKLKKYKFDAIERGILITVGDGRNYYSGWGDMGNYFYMNNDMSVHFNNNINILKGFPDNKFFYSYAWGGKSIHLYKIFYKKGKLKYSELYFALYDVNDWLKDKWINNQHKIIPKYNNKLDSLCMVVSNNKLLAGIKSRYRIHEIESEIRLRTITCELQKLYAEMHLNIPVKFMQFGKNIYILNFEKKIIYRLSETGFPEGEIVIDKAVLNDYGDIEEIISNQEETRCFIRCKGVKTKLKEIDLETGRYIRTIDLTYSNVEKIRIVGNYIYYTARVEGFNGDERWLYKETINDLLGNK